MTTRNKQVVPHATTSVTVAVIALSVLGVNRSVASDETNAPAKAISSDNGKEMIALAEVAPEAYYAFRRYPKFYGDPNTEVGNLWDRTQLSGNWGGLRDKATDHGVYVDVSLTQFIQGNVAGGNQQGPARYNGSADYWLTLDSGKAGLWPGGGIFLHAESSWLANKSVNGDTGSLLPANYDATMPSPGQSQGMALPELYLAQGLPANLMLLVGKIDFAGLGDQNVFANNERTQFEYTGLVNNPILGAFIPYTPLGVVLSWTPSREHNLALLGLQAIGNGTTSGFDNFNGQYTVGMQYTFSPKLADRLPGNYRLIVGYDSKQILAYDVDPRQLIGEIIGVIPPIHFNANYGLMLNADQYLWTRDQASAPADAPSRKGLPPVGVGLFFRAGWVPANRNVIDQFYSFGIGGYGLIPGRDRDRWGLGWAGTHISSDLRRDAALLGKDLNTFEHGFEAFYNFAVTPASHVTFNVQVIDSVNPSVNTAVVVGTRFQLDF